MITKEGQGLVLDLALKRISEDMFFRLFPADLKLNTTFAVRELEDALIRKDAAQVECALLLTFHFGNQERHAAILCKLLLEDWHHQHENIASLLQDLKDPSSIECLYQTALTHFAYLDYDEAYALAVKCIWALGDINTDDAKGKLLLLAHSDNDIIRENALEQLQMRR